MNSAKKGQTLIIIFFLVLLALSIGITISTRYIRSTRSIIRTDNSVRALAGAESLAERLLANSYAVLQDFISNNSCGSSCILDITYPEGQIMHAVATLSETSTAEAVLSFNVNQSDVYEISLSGYTGNAVRLCWDTNASIYASYIYSSGSTTSMNTYAYNPTSSILGNGFSTAAASEGYNSCFDVPITNTPRLLRVRPYYEDSLVHALSSIGSTFPIQGILIEVSGTSGDSTRHVKVEKTSPMLPSIFDMVVLQKSLTDPLSNSGL
ncbi:hypothetical protein A2450_00945 [candidate division WWE3 bacterium RIFOXYC2_FULL_40_11]|nr:MAG: hypothetical protein A2450_00945 [candidate division WWE3 bacterium RIFOXYC2_FULL_40_11]OGC71159.1 MAG: hypothetical protein A2602_01575 [candidate division WWE3 bacterium RIFOXYD1_FULL_40_11]HLD51189.1 hypothetical protein [Patescibacteria group bacterium]